MKILYLHGMFSTPGGIKPTFLREHGHEVFEPSLPPYSFEESLANAQEMFDMHNPNVVVGSSRGGAVAMNLKVGDVPLALIAPAWNWQPVPNTVKKGTIILHSQNDEVVPFEHTRQLACRSGLPQCDVIVVGENHRINDPAALEALLMAVERAANNYTPRKPGSQEG